MVAHVKAEGTVLVRGMGHGAGHAVAQAVGQKGQQDQGKVVGQEGQYVEQGHVDMG